MSQRDLHHATLDTGDAAMVPRDHLQPGTADLLRPILRDLAHRGEATLPAPLEGWTITAGSEPGRCLSAMILAPTRLSAEPAGIAWIGVARHSRCGSGLWRSMHQLETGSDPLTDPDRQPATPWLATRMLPAAALIDPQRLAMIADLSECLAWTWMEDTR